MMTISSNCIEVIPVIPHGTSCSRCAIRYRDNRPSAITVSLGDRQTIKLPFGQDNALTLVPEMCAKERQPLSITNNLELFAFPLDLLGNGVPFASRYTAIWQASP